MFYPFPFDIKTHVILYKKRLNNFYIIKPLSFYITGGLNLSYVRSTYNIYARSVHYHVMLWHYVFNNTYHNYTYASYIYYSPLTFKYTILH